MQIDCYGFEATSQFFKRKELDAHLMNLEGQAPKELHFCRVSAMFLQYIRRAQRSR